jgi:hypothetical protein
MPAAQHHGGRGGRHAPVRTINTQIPYEQILEVSEFICLRTYGWKYWPRLLDVETQKGYLNNKRF